MAIREDLEASAVQFLQDPNVSSSSVENKINFLRSKNLTQEEIDHALARTGAVASSGAQSPYHPPSPPQPYFQSYSGQAWQPQPPPRRDWRDWFIMATVVGSVSYGLYSLGKRYVYPLIAPPTPEKLEQDKKMIQDQFERAFALVEQLAKDTDELKRMEKQRTEKLDAALAELETAMTELKTANRRQDDDAQRIRQDIQGLKEAIPKAMESHKTQADNRLHEINNELASLKTLVSQRMKGSNSASSTNGHLRQGASSTSATSSGAPATSAATPKPAAVSDVSATKTETASTEKTDEAPKTPSQGSMSSKGSGKASIPAWQMAMANKNKAESSSAEGGNNAGEGSSSSA